MKLDLGGGSPVTLASGQKSPIVLAVDAADIYWKNDGTASGLDKDGAIMGLAF